MKNFLTQTGWILSALYPFLPVLGLWGSLPSTTLEKIFVRVKRWHNPYIPSLDPSDPPSLPLSLQVERYQFIDGRTYHDCLLHKIVGLGTACWLIGSTIGWRHATLTFRRLAQSTHTLLASTGTKVQFIVTTSLAYQIVTFWLKKKGFFG